jgi:hypothetical protein
MSALSHVRLETALDQSDVSAVHLEAALTDSHVFCGFIFSYVCV